MKRSVASLAAATALLVPLGAEPARAYTPPAAASLTVANVVGTVFAKDDVLEVTGEVTNQSAYTLAASSEYDSGALLVVRYFDHANALIAEGSPTVMAANLAPGATSAFVTAVSPIPTGYDHFTVSTVDPQVSDTLSNTRFTTEVASAVTGPDDYCGCDLTTVTGYVTNDNTAAVPTPRVWGVYRDANGAVVDVVEAWVNNPSYDSQDAGIKLRWQFSFGGDRISRNAPLALTTYATTFVDPSPMTNDVGSRPSAVLRYNATIAPTVRVVKPTTNGAPASEGTVVTLQRQSGTSWVNVTSAATSWDFPGVVSFAAQRPRVRTVYRAVTLADNQTAFRAGTPFAVQVAMYISRALSATTIRPTGYAYLTGKTSVSHAGQRIYLQRYYSGAWHTLRYTTLSSTSTYKFVLRPGRVGTYYFRVYRPTDTKNYASASAKVTLKVG